MGSEKLTRYIALVTLVAQNSALALFMRYSRANAGDGPVFAATTAVVLAELMKFGASLGLQAWTDGSVAGLVRTIREDVVSKPLDQLKMAVPALLYVVQNNLAYVAISNLDSATYQLTYQLKILTTALFSVFMLHKSLSGAQWTSLVLLALGVGLVQLSSSSPSKRVDANSGNPLVGLIAVLAACCTSGFAGVYFEKVLKGSKVSLWVRNMQLAGYGIAVGLAGVYFTADGAAVRERGFLYGYTFAAWMSVLLNSLGGLIVAMVIKYADNVVKGFATSISIVATCVVSFFLFSFSITSQFLAGASLVLYATYLYAKMPTKPASSDGESPHLSGTELPPVVVSEEQEGLMPRNRTPSMSPQKDAKPRKGASGASAGNSNSSKNGDFA